MLPFSSCLRRLAMTCAVPALLAGPALADPTVGIGLSVAFGGGKTESGIGLRLFSDDRRDRGVASLGIDYMFNAQRWRGTAGVAYLGDNAYIGLDLGIGLGDGRFDFGPSIGFVDAKAPPPAPPASGGGGSGYDD